MQNQRADGCRCAFIAVVCLCSRAPFGWLGAGLGGRWRARAWSARGASRFGQCGRARNRRGAVAGRQNGPALHATPAPMYAVILRVTRGPCGRLARVGVQSRVEWCFPKWAEVLCSLTCLLEAHTKITVLAPNIVPQTLQILASAWRSCALEGGSGRYNCTTTHTSYTVPQLAAHTRLHSTVTFRREPHMHTLKS